MSTLTSLIRPRPMPYGGRAVPGCSARCTVKETGSDFRERLSSLGLNDENGSQRVALDNRGHLQLLGDKERAPRGGHILPLRHAALSQALETIEDRQEWLMGGEPIFKAERNGNARIDFLNRGGFVFNQAGEYVSHSTNGW